MPAIKFFHPFLSRDIYIIIRSDLKDFTLHVLLCKLTHFEQRNNSRIKISISLFNSSATDHDI